MKQYFMTVTVARLLGICRDSYLKLFLSLAPQAMILLCMQDCGASVVWRPSLPLINSFNKTEAIFPFSVCKTVGRQWCGILHYHWWTASIKPRLLFSPCFLRTLTIFLELFILSTLGVHLLKIVILSIT